MRGLQLSIPVGPELSVLITLTSPSSVCSSIRLHVTSSVRSDVVTIPALSDILLYVHLKVSALRCLSCGLRGSKLPIVVIAIYVERVSELVPPLMLLLTLAFPFRMNSYLACLLVISHLLALLNIFGVYIVHANILLQWAKSESHSVLDRLKQIYFVTKVYTSHTWLLA